MKKGFVVLLAFALLFQTAFAFQNGEWLQVDTYEQRQNDTIDRGEICKYLVDLYEYVTWDSAPAIENPFWDVDEEQQPYILDAYALGFVSGTGDGAFSPKNELSRGALSVMLLRVAEKISPFGNFGGGAFITFPDGAPDWAYEALQFTYSRGITKGRDTSAVGAEDFLTLGEAIDMVERTMYAIPNYDVLYTEFMGKKAYLTFDDGTSFNTVSILNTLAEKNAKATFFVTGRADIDLLLRMKDEGHSVGNHTMSHDYKKLYAGSGAFWDDFKAEEAYLEGILGYKPTLMRFPGGSNNTVSYNYGGKGLMKALTAQAREYGYTYVVWNVGSGDADAATVPKDTIVKNVLNGAKNKESIVILMHQTAPKTTTAQALPEIIDGLRNMGFALMPMTEQSYTPQFLR